MEDENRVLVARKTSKAENRVITTNRRFGDSLHIHGIDTVLIYLRDLIYLQLIARLLVHKNIKIPSACFG